MKVVWRFLLFLLLVGFGLLWWQSEFDVARWRESATIASIATPSDTRTPSIPTPVLVFPTPNTTATMLPIPTPNLTIMPSREPSPAVRQTRVAALNSTFVPERVWTVTPSVAAVKVDTDCEEGIVNGGFEEDEGWVLPLTREKAGYSAENPRTGQYAMQLGGRSTSTSFAIAQQRVALPEDAVSAEISFWSWADSAESDENDKFGLFIYDQNMTQLLDQYVWDGASNDVGWVQMRHHWGGRFGRIIVLHFVTVNDGIGTPSTLYLDDVSLRICYQ